MKKIMLLLSVVVFIAISCDSKKKSIPADTEISDSDSILSDEINILPDDETSENDDVADNDGSGNPDIENDEEVGDENDEDPYPYTECDLETKNCGGTEICLFVWEKGKYYCLPSCDPESATPCEGEKVCEPVLEEINYGCFPRLRVSGKVFNLESEMYEPVEGATVVGMFTSGISTDTILTDSLGNYEFFVR
ncbi:MAG TPA: hypothetical protein VLJ60_10015, partial [bacterium]|nr:hypothetical protein [bacterium]